MKRITLLMGILFLSGQVWAQESRNEEVALADSLLVKATDLANRFQYDSALYYFDYVAECYQRAGLLASYYHTLK